MNQVFVHSCEEMKEIPDNSVALTVTSPPYWNAIDYDIHAADKTRHYRTRAYGNGYTEYSNYLDWLTRVFSEVLRVTKPGGFCAIVIGTVLQDRKHYPAPFDCVSRLAAAGWDFHQDIIWHKCTAGVKRARVAIQDPYPGYFYPNIMTEYILIFRKPGPAIYKEASPDRKAAAAYPINRLFTMDIANSVWHIAPVPPDLIDHPCPFPEEIPHRLITLYSYPGDLVLDPFSGSGQTVKVARKLGRRFVAYETVQKYADLTMARSSEPLCLREYQLIAEFGKVHIDAPSGEGGKGGVPVKGRPRGRPKKVSVDATPSFL